MIDPTSFGADEWRAFAAHLHPLLLHAPLGLLFGTLLLELYSLFSASAAGPRRAINVFLGLSAAAAATTGWLLGGNGEYSGTLVDDHRTYGIAAAGAAVLVMLLDVFGRSGRVAFLRRVVVLATGVLLMVTGHHGGMITHGRTFLSDHAPPWLAPYVGTLREPRTNRPEPADPRSTDADSPSVEAAVDPGAGTPAEGGGLSALPVAVEPGNTEPGSTEPGTATSGTGDRSIDLSSVVAAFQARCFECHNETKTKGKLRLDVLDGWRDQVDTESVEDSEILYRVMLPADDADAMPPKGERLSPEVIEALRGWIEAGASEEELGALLGGAQAVAEQAADTLEDIERTSGARIDELDALDGEAPLSVSWSHAPEPPSPERVTAIAPIAERIVELSFAGTSAGDAEVDALPELSNLARVHLERSGVTDAGVAALVGKAPAIAYLNLHSTGVTPAVRQSLDRLANLEDAVLFATAADPAPSEDPFASVGVAQPRRILAADASKRRVALLREMAIGKPEVIWEREIDALHDLQWLGESDAPGARGSGHGRVLVQESWTRIVEIDTATDEVRWSYDAAPTEGERVEIHSFRRLADGSTMVAESGRTRLVIVGQDGEPHDVIPLQVSASDPHRDTRLVRETPAGTFLVAHEGDGTVKEYNRDGGVVWSFDVPLAGRERAPGHGPDAHGNQVFGALRLASGDTLISTGNGSSFLRVNPAGEVVWSLEQEGIEGVRLAWTTGVQELSNGHLVLGNCHAGPDQPQAIEVTPEGERVWSFHDFERFGDGLSNLVVIERTP